MKCLGCLQKVRLGKKPCKDSECRHWIDHSKDLNCTFEAIEKNDGDTMTLREVAKRLGISFVRVKQIEDAALKKILLNDPQLVEYLLKDEL